MLYLNCRTNDESNRKILVLGLVNNVWISTLSAMSTIKVINHTHIERTWKVGFKCILPLLSKILQLHKIKITVFEKVSAYKVSVF